MNHLTYAKKKSNADPEIKVAELKMTGDFDAAGRPRVLLHI